MNPGEQTPKQEIKLLPEVRELIRLFQKFREANDLPQQQALATQFYKKLGEIIAPPSEEWREQNPETIRRSLSGEEPNHILYITGGTSGQRIQVTDSILVSTPESAERLGQGAKQKKSGNSIELENADGRPRWMAYYKPEGTSWSYGERYYTQFVEKFGGEIVDLLQEINQ